MSRWIKIERESDDRLSKQVWAFWADGFDIMLHEYTTMSRPTRRHKYVQKGDGYCRYNRRVRSCEVPFPDDLREEVVRAVLSKIRIVVKEET